MANRSMFWRLFGANALYWACVSVYSPFLSGYFTRIGMDATQIGVLVATLPVCSIVTQPFVSAWADRLGARKLVLVCASLVSAALALLYYAVSGFWGLLAVCLAFNAVFQSLLPLCDSLVVGACDRWGVDFSRVRMGGTVGYMLFVTVAGVLFEDVPAAQFATLAGSIALFAFVAALLPQPWREAVRARAASGEAKAAEPAGKGLSAIFTTPQVALVLTLCFICYTGAAFHSTFLGRWVVELGYGQDMVGIICALSASTEIPILLVMNRLIDRVGEVRLLVLSTLAMALRLALVGIGSMPVLLAAQLLQCVSFMTMSYSCITYVARHTRTGAEARGQSVLVMIQSGFATVLANLAGGVACDAFGTGVGFMVCAAVMVVAVALTVVVARAKGQLAKEA